MRLKLLLIEHGGIHKRFTIDTILRREDVELYVVTKNIEPWLFKIVKNENIFISNTDDCTQLLLDISIFKLQYNIKFDAIGTYVENYVTQMADISATFGLINISSGAARRSSRNKIETRNFCRGVINQPNYSILDLSSNIFFKKLENIGFPYVIKPIDGMASCGVRKIDFLPINIEDFISEILLETQLEMKNEMVMVNKSTVMIEQYIPGNLYSVDGIVQKNKVNIVGIMEFIMGNEPMFIQEGGYTPANINISIKLKISKFIEQIIKVLDFNNCGFHCEFKIYNEEPYLIEIACRLPGGPIQMDYLHSTGFDITNAMIDVWIGKDISKILDTPKMFIYHKDVFAINEGVITNINCDNKKIHDLTWDFIQFAKVNDITTVYPKKPSKLYYYAVIANSYDELLKKSEQVEKLVNYSIKTYEK